MTYELRFMNIELIVNAYHLKIKLKKGGISLFAAAKG